VKCHFSAGRFFSFSGCLAPARKLHELCDEIRARELQRRILARQY